MEALIIFRTKFGAVKRIARTFNGMDHVDNYIAYMYTEYGWMVDELFLPVTKKETI
jgi:hypothetical protein